MHWRVCLFIITLGILSIPLSLAHADPPLQEAYLKIYLKLNTAEQSEKQGDLSGALEAFKDCYAGLMKIHEQDPDWEKALVIHRMEDCKAKILDLQARGADNVPPPQPTAVATPVPPPTEPPIAPTEPVADTVPALKQRLQEVEAELQATKKDLLASQSMVQAYRDQLQTVNQQLKALKSKTSVDDRVTRLLSENKILTDKLTMAQKQIDGVKLSPKSKLALAQQQLKNLQEQFDASQATNASLQQTITNLQQHLDQAQADLVASDKKLADAGTSSPEYATIKHENEVMRAILQRELQEQARRDQAKRLAQEELDNLKLKSSVLQEQLDILSSAMTPATNDDERALLASLKTPAPDVAPTDTNTGNTFAAPAAHTADASTNAPPVNPPAPPVPPGPDATMTSPPATNAAPAPSPDATALANATNAPPPTPPAPDASTNAAPVTVASNDQTPPSAPTPPPSSPSVNDASTNSTPAVSAPPVANTPDPGAPISPTVPTVTPPVTNAPDTTVVASLPPSTDTTSTPPSNPPSDPPTVSHIDPPTTSVTDTTIQNNSTPTDTADATQYSTKARLPDDMRETAQQAADLFKMQRYDEAAGKYQNIIDKYPESLYAWSNLGVVRFQQGDMPDALKALQQAVKLSPTDAFSYANLGIVYYQLGQYENAIDALNAAKALDPNDAKTRNYLGCSCSQKGWQEVAEKEFRKAIELDPNFGDAHFNLALVYATSKPPSLELARKEYNRALELGIAKDDRLEKLLNPAP